MKLKLLIPKGRIFQNIASLFDEAGLALKLAERTYRTIINENFEAKIMKPQNVGELLELGAHDCGFTGYDWIEESGADVKPILDLGFDRVKIVAACPAQTTLRELRSKKIVVATEYVHLAGEWLKKQNYDYRIVRTFGATEVFPPDDADLIVDNTSTGKTLSDNGLKIIDTLLESSTWFVASKKALLDPYKRAKIDELTMLFNAVLEGRGKIMLEMNVSKANFEKLVRSIPAMRSPTVSPLYGETGFAVKIAVKKSDAPTLIPQLKAFGATDIVEYELRKVVY
jgi:ATP phosphoribosyltransferase